MDTVSLDGGAGEIESEQLDLRFIAIGRTPNDANEFVEISKSDEKTFQHLRPFLGFLQLKTSPAKNDLASMLNVAIDQLFQTEGLWTPMIDRQHVDRKGAFELGEFIEIVDDNLRHGVTPDLNDHTGVFIRFIAH